MKSSRRCNAWMGNALCARPEGHTEDHASRTDVMMEDLRSQLSTLTSERDDFKVRAECLEADRPKLHAAFEKAMAERDDARQALADWKQNEWPNVSQDPKWGWFNDRLKEWMKTNDELKVELERVKAELLEARAGYANWEERRKLTGDAIYAENECDAARRRYRAARKAWARTRRAADRLAEGNRSLTEQRDAARSALSSDAGKRLLEELEALRSERDLYQEAYEAADCLDHVTTDKRQLIRLHLARSRIASMSGGKR